MSSPHCPLESSANAENGITEKAENARRIDKMIDNDKTRAIIKFLIELGHTNDMEVIAEGVETMEIADYMKSIGCNYIQGYLYSKPITDEEYIKMLGTLDHEPMDESHHLLETIDSGKFWDPESMETLIFSNFVGPAAIFSYDSETDNVEILRVNQKYIKEVGLGRTEKQIIAPNVLQVK